MIKILNFTLLLGIVQFFVWAGGPVFADTVNFDDRSSEKACFTATLNETIAVKVNGQTGAGCEFSVDVGAGGEFVGAGGYFGSPPYAWGTDTFHTLSGIERNDKYSFTCSQPSYELDESGLPSYISLTKAEDIPAGDNKPDGKRYFFSVGAQAETGKSFNAPFKYSTDCAMKKKGLDDINPMTPIGHRRSGERCSQVNEREINPREKTSSFPITIGTSCGPPPACNAECESDEYCQDAQDGCTSCLPTADGTGSVCTKPPACGDVCTTPADCQGSRDGCTQCIPNPNGSGNVCQPPPPPACNSFCSSNNDCSLNNEGCVECVAGQCRVPPACNVACTKDSQCEGAKDGCTSCVDGSCKVPPACNASCTDDEYCQAGDDGCTSCLPNDAGTGNVCRQTPACNVACTRDGQCQGAKDGCTVCLPGDSGTGNVCRPAPACNVACTKDGQCQGAKDGCTECDADETGKTVCQVPFSDDMCKCDGFNAINLKYPNAGNIQFESFAKVEGANIKRAKVESIQFKLYKSAKSNPNKATVVASSDVISPQIVENTSTKQRYKATWNVAPPTPDVNSIYRVGANIKCAPKSGTADAGQFIPGGDTLSSDSNVLASFERSYSQDKYKLVQIPQDDDALQLGELNFLRMVDTDACSFLRFEYFEP